MNTKLYKHSRGVFKVKYIFPSTTFFQLVRVLIQTNVNELERQGLTEISTDRPTAPRSNPDSGGDFSVSPSLDPPPLVFNERVLPRT